MNNVLFLFECLSYRLLKKTSLHRLRELRTNPGVFCQESENAVFCYDRNALSFAFSSFNSLWIRTRVASWNEGEDAVRGNYCFDSIKPDEVVLARCNLPNNYITLCYQFILWNSTYICMHTHTYRYFLIKQVWIWLVWIRHKIYLT